MARVLYSRASEPRDLPITSTCYLQGVKPSQQFRAPSPPWRLAGLRRRINLFERFSFGLQIGSRIVVCRIQMGMPEPASNHGTSTPAATRLTAVVWRKTCGVTFFREIVGTRARQLSHTRSAGSENRMLLTARLSVYEEPLVGLARRPARERCDYFSRPRPQRREPRASR